MSGSEFVDLSGPYGSRPHASGGDFLDRPPSRSISSRDRKAASGTYNPILTPQDEDETLGFPAQGGPDPYGPSTDLGSGRIGKFGTDLLVEVTVCAFAVLVSVPFIWLAVTMASFHHEDETESRTHYIKEATSTISTLFTILFAAVLGSTLKRYANWRLERGIRLGLLEQLLQSRTVFAAVTTLLSFRAINLMAVVLLSAWTFSPLGSQASLRLISARDMYTTDVGLVSYLDTITNQVFDTVSGVESLMTALKPTYISSILGSDSMKNASMDMWSNVRIPWLGDNASTDNNGWTTLTRANMTEASYSSLVGVPVMALANRNSSFAVETTYMNLDCEKPKDETPINISFNMTSGNGTFVGPNTTIPNSDEVYPSWQVAMNEFVNDDLYFYGYPEELVNVSDANLPQATFLFQSKGPWVARCKINQIYVESNVSCASVSDSAFPACSVVGQRKSPNRHAPSTVTTLSFPSTFSSMMYYWIMATGPLLDSGYSTLTEYYLQNTSTTFILSGNDREFADYSNVTAEAFSQRLGQLLNTWVIAGQASANNMDFGLTLRNTSATYTSARRVYVCSWAWLAVYVTAIAVMLTAALFSIWCVRHTTIPDVLSYCSSLTRDSPFFNFVKGGSTLDGIARARRLENLEVRLGAIGGEADNGRFHNDFVNDLGPDFTDGQKTRLVIAPPKYLRTPKRGTWYD